MVIADHLSDEDRSRYFDEHFRPGLVLKLRCPWLPVYYDKILVLVCTEPSPILLFINSEILELYKHRPAFSARQVALSAGDYAEFLDHDSYIDCTTPIDRFSKREIKERVLRDMERLRGRVNDGTLREVLKQVSAAKMMEYPKKRRIVEALRLALELGE